MPHILVVDDEPSVCDVISSALKSRAGWTVECANCAEEAESLIERHCPDAAVIDVLLPGKPGWALAKEALDQDVPVLLMAGHPETLRQLRTLGYVFLQKPFRVAELMRRIDETLALSAGGRAALAGRVQQMLD